MSAREQTERPRFDTSAVITLSGAHFMHDVFTAFVAALLPLLIVKFDLTLTEAGTLSALTQAPSLLNPILGWVVDRGGFARVLVIITPGATGALLCTMGLAPDYVSLSVLLLAAGISIAAIHLTGPTMVAQVSGDRVGRGMGMFMVGGELARTAGPLVAVQIVSVLTLEGMWRLIPVCLAASALLWWRLAGVPSPVPAPGDAGPLAVLSDIGDLWRRTWRTIGPVGGILMSRAFVAAAALTFLPTFMVSEGESLWFANLSLSVLELAGAAGALASGTLSDLLGRRKVLIAVTSLSPVMMALFLLADGPLVFPALIGLGVATVASTPVLMAAVIEVAGPNRAAANGTYMMMSFALRSLIMVAVGAMGDAIGLRPTYALCALIATLGVPFAALLPKVDGRRLRG
jgi:FSR family fosmidomycin resistance protein-like MFS transporter